LWPFGSFAVAGFFDLRQVTAQVVAEAAGQVVDAFLFDQPIRSVVGEGVSGVVFVDQGGQAISLVLVAEYRLRYTDNLSDQEMTETILPASNSIKLLKINCYLKTSTPNRKI
jgi:hypothetical protein